MTKREDAAAGQWKNWNWRSEGDLFLNGAFFVPSGAGATNPYAKASSLGARSSNLVGMITAQAGALSCRTGKACWRGVIPTTSRFHYSDCFFHFPTLAIQRWCFLDNLGPLAPPFSVAWSVVHYHVISICDNSKLSFFGVISLSPRFVFFHIHTDSNGAPLVRIYKSTVMKALMGAWLGPNRQLRWSMKMEWSWRREERD